MKVNRFILMLTGFYQYKNLLIKRFMILIYNNNNYKLI